MKNKQTGFTLIEALIAIIVLAIGLLGLGQMSVRMLTSSQDSKMKQMAVMLIADITDAMRANQAGFAAGAYNNPVTPTVTASCLTSAGCTAAQMSSSTYALWQQQVARALPGGNSVVCLDSTPDDGTSAAPACDGIGTFYVVKIWWTDRRLDATNQQRLVTVVNF